jgi:pimeloyl-ACP methyl ester carboxylesterase
MDLGAGEPALVLMHYFGGSAREWAQVADILAEKHQCFAVDMPGFGAANQRQGFSVEDMVADLKALVEGLNLKRYILVGHSMSGKVAITLAASQPAGLEGLILAAPSPPSPEPMSDKDRHDMLQGYGKRSAAEATVKKITAHPLPPALFNMAVEDNLLSSAAAWTAWLKHGSREDLSRQVGVLDLPALVVAGEKDPVLPAPIQTRDVLPHLSQGRLEIVPDSGHLIPLEQPAALSSLITGFCGTLAASHS